MLEVDSLCFSYGNREIFKNISFDVRDGQSVAILGNNGAGKSTMIKCLNKILSPQGGGVLINGKSVAKMKQREVAKNLAYVPQACSKTAISVYDAIMLGRKPYINISASGRDMEIVDGIIEKLRLQSIKLKPLNEISGGEAQLVILGRALAQEPKTLLLDEPTSSLDMRNQFEVMNVVREICRESGISVILVIHDINAALRYCDRFLFMKSGKVFSYGGEETVTTESIEAVYGVATDMIYHNGKKYFIACDAV